MTKKRWAVACTVLAMTALAACGESGSTATPGGAAPSAGAPGGAAGGGETFKIGVFGPEQIPQGQDVRDGALLAAEEINAKGQGPKVEIVLCDSEAKPDKAITCVTRFAQQDRVQAITGGFSSAETLAMLDTVVRAKIPYVSAGAAAPDVTKGVDSTGPRKYIFRVGPVNSLALAADMCTTYVAKLSPQAGFTKFGILYEDAAFAIPLVEFLSKCLVNPKAASGGAIPIDKGVQFVGAEKHTPAATDFSAQFKALKDKGAQFVIEVNSTQVGIAVGKQWGTLKPGFALGGINVAGTASQYFDATGKAVEGELNGPAAILRAPISPKTIPFYDAFQAKYGRDPLYNGVATYDGVYTLHEAAVKAGSLNADQLVTALAASDRIGVAGVERFNEQHDLVYGAGDPKKGATPIYFQFDAQGKKSIVFPEALAEGRKYKKPPGVS